MFSALDWIGLFASLWFDLWIAHWVAAVASEVHHAPAPTTKPPPAAGTSGTPQAAMPLVMTEEPQPVVHQKWEPISYGGRMWLPINGLCAVGLFLLWRSEGKINGRDANGLLYEPAIALHAVATMGLCAWAIAYYRLRKKSFAIVTGVVISFMQISAVVLASALKLMAAILMMPQLAMHFTIVYVTMAAFSKSKQRDEV